MCAKNFIGWLRYKFPKLRRYHKDELKAKLNLPLLSCGNVTLRVQYRNVRNFCPLTNTNADSLVPWERTQALTAPYWNEIYFIENNSEKLKKKT